MSTVLSRGVPLARPAAVSAAVVLTVLSQIGTLPFFFLPGSEDIPTAALVFGLLLMIPTLLGAWGLWNLRRWGAILTFVLTLLNTLSAVPGLFEPPSGWIFAGLLIVVPIGIATLVLIALPSARRAYR